MPNDDQTDRGVRRRISKACEPCRQRKAKCDGRLPCCSVCASHGGDPALCKYRNRTRVRTTHRASTPEVSRPAAGPGEIARRNLGLPEVPRTEIESSTAQTTNEQDYCHNAFIGVNAAQSHAQLYYGSSSIFAFLQHIHQTFNDPDRRAIHQRDQDGGMERFRHRDRFFPSDSLGHGGQEAIKGQCLLLPEPLARLFLDNYLKSIHNLMPWLSAEQLVKMLDTVCSPDPEQQVQITNSDTAIILLSLACGASLVKHSRWIDVLVERALAQVPRLEMAINLRSVQISLLLAHVSVCRGRHNSAYIYLGSAARKAFAAGLHKDVDYQANQQNKAERAENLRLTFWSLAFLERWFSFWLGRPSAIDGVVISTPMPESSPLIRALAELSDIIIQAAHRMYDDVRPQLAKLWESGQHIRLDLLAFQRRMKSVLDFDLDDEVKLLEDNSVQVFLLVSIFYHAWMITFRPFLVISIAWEQHREASTTENRASDKTSLPIDMWWLPEACQIALEKSRRFIKLFAAATSHSPIIRGLVFSASYVESACCLLFYDSCRDHGALDTNISCIEEAIDSLSVMVRTGSVPGVIATLQQMVVELEQVKRTGSLSLALSRNALATSRQLPDRDVQNALRNEETTPTLDVVLSTQRQTALLPFNAQYDADILDMDWSYNLPFMGMEYDQDLSAKGLGGYFNPVL